MPNLEPRITLAEAEKKADEKMYECSTLVAITELADILNDHFNGSATVEIKSHLSAVTVSIRELAKSLNEKALLEMEGFDELIANLKAGKEVAHG